MILHLDAVFHGMALEFPADLFGFELDESQETFETAARISFSGASLGTEYGIEQQTYFIRLAGSIAEINNKLLR